jgi:hypothetical protein
VYGNLGQIDEAKAAGAKLMELLPRITLRQLRERLPYFRNPSDLERYLAGLGISGLPD